MTVSAQQGEVLVVDDSPETLEFLEDILSEDGYAVRTAPTGELALWSVQHSLPDLVILDLRMPDIDGIETCRMLKRQERTAGIPVIFISGASDVNDRIAGFDAGGVDFIIKPFGASDVLARVGTHMRMSLAAKRLLAQHAEMAARSEASAATSRSTEILVVEDTPASLQLLSTVLSNAGYVVREAANGELALWTASKRPPDLILLDIRMPGMNGFDVCRCLKADAATADIPVIFLSALSDVEDKAEGFSAGAVDYITKPFSEQEVLARVKNHLKLAASLQSRVVPMDKFPPRHELHTPLLAPDIPADVLSLDALIHDAVHRQEMVLLYQPKYSAAGRLAAADVIPQWRVPGREPLLPDAFMPLAEATGESLPIGAWLINHVCRQIRAWASTLPSDFVMIIEISALQFWQEALPQTIQDALHANDLNGHHLQFHIRADTLEDDLDQGIVNLRRLATLGVGLSCDHPAVRQTELSLSRPPADSIDAPGDWLTAEAFEALLPQHV